VLDPDSDRMAISEENVGSGNDKNLIRYVDSLGLFVCRDWLAVKGMVSPLGFDGEDLFYNHVFFDKGSYYGLVMKLDGEAKERVPVMIPFFKNKSPIQSGHLSSNKEYLLISAESSNTKGVEDLYISKKNPDGSWGSMKNLGAKINSPYQEVTPFLAADNKTLFFASNRPGGHGSFDIYYAVRQDDYWNDWSEPALLGAQVNTPGSETSFSFRDDEGWAYFVRAKDSDGYGDVYKIMFKEEIEADTATTEPELKEDNEVVSDIFLKVVNATTNEALPAQFVSANKTISNVNGLFKVDTLDGTEAEVKAKGFLPKLVRLDSNLVAGSNVVKLASIAKGKTIQLQNVLFYRGTADLITGSEKELDLVVEVLNENPSIKILLKGHTDNTGDPVRNVRLSEARVKSVKAYIIAQGVSPYRVSGKGFGGNQPLASNETEETRMLNRRVEFEVIEE